MKKVTFDMSPDEVRFKSLLIRMQNESVSARTAIKIVGGKSRLERLMKEGTIRYNKPEGALNRQWEINMADCLRCVKPNINVVNMQS